MVRKKKKQKKSLGEVSKTNDLSIFEKALCFVFPMAGFFKAYNNIGEDNARAKQALSTGLAGLITWNVAQIIFTLSNEDKQQNQVQTPRKTLLQELEERDKLLENQ